MSMTSSSDWSGLVARFDALGATAQAAVARAAATPLADVATTEPDVATLSSLLAERDALLAELTVAVRAAGPADVRLAPALEQSALQTGDLIQRVAERTDALRDALRSLQRGAHVSDVYRRAAPSGAWTVIDARR
jgi:hypothetical protein